MALLLSIPIDFLLSPKAHSEEFQEPKNFWEWCYGWIDHSKINDPQIIQVTKNHKDALATQIYIYIYTYIYIYIYIIYVYIQIYIYIYIYTQENL